MDFSSTGFGGHRYRACVMFIMARSGSSFSANCTDKCCSRSASRRLNFRRISALSCSSRSHSVVGIDANLGRFWPTIVNSWKTDSLLLEGAALTSLLLLPVVVPLPSMLVSLWSSSGQSGRMNATGGKLKFSILNRRRRNRNEITKPPDFFSCSPKKREGGTVP
uniref:(northern house mosquito) hypothetical protein n=1 Tax=Culex pipiens TaxID=7175 RepID=A0A8D8P9F9_CULPI